MRKRKRLMSLIAAGIITISSSFYFEIEGYSDNNKVKNVILLVGDGMSHEGITLSRYIDDNQELAIDKIASGAVRTYWANGPITDSAPGGTAFSTGQKTDKKNIATSVDGQALSSILESSKLLGKATGIVGTSEITHATLADFSSHIDDRNDYKTIIQQQANSGIDVFLGGGMGSDSKYKDLKDENNKDISSSEFKNQIKTEIKNAGYDLVETNEEMNSSNSSKLWGMFADGALSIDFDRKNNDSKQPTLAQMTKKAIDTLKKDEDGFFLMVEGSQIDWQAHANNSVGIITEILAFDKAVEEALNFAKTNKDTVVIVTTDHGNSGITIGNSINSNNYSSLTFDESVNNYKNVKISEDYFNENILPSIISDNNKIKQEVKNNFNIDNLTDEEINLIKNKKINKVISDRFGIGFTTGGHTSEDVYLGVYAPSGVDKLKGVVNNIEIPNYISRVMGIENNLSSTTQEIYKNGNEVFKGNYSIKESYKPEVTIKMVNKSGKNINLKLYLNTNKYTLNGQDGTLKTVMPYIKGKFFIPQELIDLVEGGN